MAVYYILPIFARVTTKTNYMKFRKLRIIRAGVTTNFGVHEGEGHNDPKLVEAVSMFADSDVYEEDDGDEFESDGEGEEEEEEVIS